MGNRASEPLTVEHFRQWWDNETHHRGSMPSEKAAAVLSHLSKFTNWDVQKGDLSSIVSHMSLGRALNYDEARRLFYRFTSLYDVLIARDLDEHISEVVNLRPYLDGSHVRFIRDLTEAKPKDSYLSLLPNDVLITLASLVKPPPSKIINPPTPLVQTWRREIYGHIEPEVHVVGQLLFFPIHLSGGMYIHAVCTRTGEAMWQSAKIPSVPEMFGVSESGLVLHWNHHDSALHVFQMPRKNAVKLFTDFLAVNNLEGAGDKIYMVAALKNSRRMQQVYAVERAADGTVTSSRVADLGEVTGAPKLSAFDTPVGPIGVVRSIDSPGPLIVFLDKKDTTRQMHISGWLPSVPITVCGNHMLIACDNSLCVYTLPFVTGLPMQTPITIHGYGVSTRVFQTSLSSAVLVSCIKDTAEVHQWNEEAADRPASKRRVNGLPEISVQEGMAFAPSADGAVLLTVLRSPPKPPGIVHEDKNVVYTARWLDVSEKRATECRSQVLPGLLHFESILLHDDSVIALSRPAITCFAQSSAN